MTEQIYVTDGHLGGYVANGDSWTWCPALWDFFINDCAVSSVIDVGCGEGHSLKYFRDRGCEVFGIEGIAQDDPDILEWDFTKGAFYPLPHDLAWCCEFVEHVEERFVPNFLPCLFVARLIAMTHAVPGQQGYHHVNCRDAEYWKGVMAAHGRRYEEELTIKARELAPNTHFARTGMIFTT